MYVYYITACCTRYIYMSVYVRKRHARVCLKLTKKKTDRKQTQTRKCRNIYRLAANAYTHAEHKFSSLFTREEAFDLLVEARDLATRAHEMLPICSARPGPDSALIRMRFERLIQKRHGPNSDFQNSAFVVSGGREDGAGSGTQHSNDLAESRLDAHMQIHGSESRISLSSEGAGDGGARIDEVRVQSGRVVQEIGVEASTNLEFYVEALR
jgi:hypothetical protein